MSEPIILTERPELDALIAAAVAVAEAMSPEERAAMVEAQRQSWVRGEQGLRRPTESASPPRALVGITGPVLPVESGPGQPIDGDVLSRDCAAAASSLRRINTGGMINHDFDAIVSATYALESAAAEIRRLRAESESRYRAGIEAAARVECSCCRDGVPFHLFFINSHVLPDGTERACVAYRIRTLADTLPVDPLLAGLKYALQLIEGGRQSVYADSTWDAAAHRRSGDKYFALLNAEIAARKGG